MNQVECRMLGNREAEEVKVILQEDFTVNGKRFTVHGLQVTVVCFMMMLEH